MAHDLNVIIFLALAAPIGEWEGSNEVRLTAEDKISLSRLLQQYPLLRTDFEANYVYRGCGAVKEILYLTPYGDVFACPFLHNSLGNVKNETLVEIRKKALENKYFKEYYHLCLAAECIKIN